MDTLSKGGRRASPRRYRHRSPSFGLPKPQQIAARAKASIMDRARRLSRERRQPGQHGGPLTHATEKVLRVLLYKFHNNWTGACFPALETIAEAAGVARSTASLAVTRLEDLGVFNVGRRIVRVRVARDEWAIRRTSNAYTFLIPPPPEAAVRGGAGVWGANTESRSGPHVTKVPLSGAPPVRPRPDPLGAVLARLGRAIKRKSGLGEGSG